MTSWTALWLLWGSMFVAIEAPAVLNKTKGDTLSEHIWKWFAIKDKTSWWLVRRGILAAFLLWLVTHFLTGG